MSDVQTRVEAGIAVLDEKMPGWAETIDLGTLDVNSPMNCVLGQLAGPDEFYGEILAELMPDVDYASKQNWAERHGFDSYGYTLGGYEELTAAWGVEIATRQQS